MKIGYLAFNLAAMGGVKIHNQAFYRSLTELGNDCRLVELRKSSLLSKLSFAARAFLMAMLFKPELIISGHINFSPLCFVLKKILGVKYAVTVHGLDAWGLKTKAKIIGLNGADKIISVSSYTANRIKNELSTSEDKFIIIHNEVNPEKFRIAPKSPALLSKYGLGEEKIILTVTRLSSEDGYKGYDKIITKMPKILKAVPDAKYLLVGSGNDTGRVKSLIKKSGLEESVILAGWVPDEELPDFYNLADVFVMPSSGEGFGIVFIEASASGIPVVAGNRDGSVDAALNGELGILVDPSDAKEIADSIISILGGRADKKFYDREYLRRATTANFGSEAIKKKIDFFIKHQI